jgi:hypothetical protein
MDLFYQKLKEKKSQASFEFIIILSIVLLLILGMFTIHQKYETNYSYKKSKFLAYNFVESLSILINQVYLSGDMTISSFSLPNDFENENKYFLFLNPSQRIIKLDYLNTHTSFPIITSDITFINTTSELEPGQYLIENNQQSIIITKK